MGITIWIVSHGRQHSFLVVTEGRNATISFWEIVASRLVQGTNDIWALEISTLIFGPRPQVAHGNLHISRQE